MAAAVRVRGDYDAVQLRELAKRSDDADQTRRLLALAAIYGGGSRTEAAKIGGVGLQTVRDWVLVGREQRDFHRDTMADVWVCGSLMSKRAVTMRAKRALSQLRISRRL